MAYTGGPVRIEDLLINAEHNLIDQSLSSRSRETPTNGDGFGLGWYGDLERPGLYRSIRPAWNDFNLRDLAEQIQSRLLIAHVRATSLATVQETNCHPFRYGNWLFVHNGEVHEVEKIHQRLLEAIAPEYFANILGTTDSELMFHLALSFGLQDDPLGALSRMVGYIEEHSRARGVADSVWMTVAVTDGRTIHAVRYASDGDAPTLYLSPDVEHVYRLNPTIAGRFGDAARAIVSEPIGEYPSLWQSVPQNSSVVVSEGAEYVIQPFRPKAARTARAR
jgi:glutamine amidotransferase